MLFWFNWKEFPFIVSHGPEATLTFTFKFVLSGTLLLMGAPAALGNSVPVLIANAVEEESNDSDAGEVEISEEERSAPPVAITQQSVALGTAPLGQGVPSAFRLFGESGLTVTHSSMIAQQAFESADPQNDRGYAYSFGLGYRFLDKYYTSFNFALAHRPNEYDEREQVRLRSTTLSLSRSPWLYGTYSFAPSLTFRLPVGRDVVERESLRTGIAPSVTIGFPPLWSGSQLVAAYSVSGTYNFHRYDFSTTGNANNRWGVSQSVSLAHPLIKDVFVRLSGSHSLLYSTRGNGREFIGHSQEIGWIFLPNAHVSVGHSNQGSLYALDGVNYDFSLLNQRNSIFYGRLTLSI